MQKQLETLHSFVFLEMKCVLWAYLMTLLMHYLFKKASYEEKVLSARLLKLVLFSLDI